MGKNPLSNEEIIKHLEEGRHFHRKKRGNYEYITTRKRQKTWSHGAYNDLYWNRIMQLKKAFLKRLVDDGDIKSKGENPSDIAEIRKNKIKQHQRLLTSLQDEMKQLRALNMFLDCTHNKEAYCSYWKIPDGIPLIQKIDDYYEFFGETLEENAKKIVNENGDVLWMTRANALFCQDCSAFLKKVED